VSSAPRARILLVEDDQSLIELLDLVLTNSGYAMTSVTDGSHVFDRVSAEKPDLIILDIMLPKLNGFEICQRIKTTPFLKHIPILILSALVQKDEIELGIRMGADIYITKPFQNHHLLEAVETLLKRRAVPESR
jgi:DNA-binding response OmpR family regulator